jgi:putative FmdB family regulatory protein
MPIYEYRCSSCGHELEALQKFADAPLTECPACKAATLVKLVSAAGFQLKGSGWYATDFRGGSAKPAAGAKAGAEAKTGGDAKAGGDAGSGGETKSSATSDAKTTPSGGCGGGCSCH